MLSSAAHILSTTHQNYELLALHYSLPSIQSSAFGRPPHISLLLLVSPTLCLWQNGPSAFREADPIYCSYRPEQCKISFHRYILFLASQPTRYASKAEMLLDPLAVFLEILQKAVFTPYIEDLIRVLRNPCFVIYLPWKRRGNAQTCFSNASWHRQ